SGLHSLFRYHDRTSPRRGVSRKRVATVSAVLTVGFSPISQAHGQSERRLTVATSPLLPSPNSMTTPNKRLAVLAPVAWRTPPRQYGAWETVAGNIAEGLVARGWVVTLFASGDSVTSARLHAVVEHGYEEDRSIDPKVAEYLHIPEVFEHAAEFDIIHSHYDFMALAYSRLVKTPVLTTIHGFSSPQILP